VLHETWTAKEEEGFWSLRTTLLLEKKMWRQSQVQVGGCPIFYKKDALFPACSAKPLGLKK
jgi:hypothetical protein